MIFFFVLVYFHCLFSLFFLTEKRLNKVQINHSLFKLSRREGEINAVCLDSTETLKTLLSVIIIVNISLI